jgi:hypothetical protein
MDDTTRFVALCATALIEGYGRDAAAIATLRATVKLRYGDAEGARVWLAVRDEIGRRQQRARQDRGQRARRA